jgi:threonine dehydrogenase-like Zn-dependent dehydrogenase
MCSRGLYAQCETTQVREQGKGAALFGYTSLYGSVPGGQAQFLRVPQAQFGPVKVPADGPDEQYLFLSDVLPTAYQAVACAGTPKGGTLALLGLGPTGSSPRGSPGISAWSGSSASTRCPGGGPPRPGSGSRPPA